MSDSKPVAPDNLLSRARELKRLYERTTPGPWTRGRIPRDEEPDTCVIGAIPEGEAGGGRMSNPWQEFWPFMQVACLLMLNGMTLLVVVRMFNEGDLK